MSCGDDSDDCSCRGCEIVGSQQSEIKRLRTALESLAEEFRTGVGGARNFGYTQRKDILSHALGRKL